MRRVARKSGELRRESTFALPPRAARSEVDKPRYGGQPSPGKLNWLACDRSSERAEAYLCSLETQASYGERALLQFRAKVAKPYKNRTNPAPGPRPQRITPEKSAGVRNRPGSDGSPDRRYRGRIGAGEQGGIEPSTRRLRVRLGSVRWVLPRRFHRRIDYSQSAASAWIHQVPSVRL
jgi:hypothetical protein